MNQSAEDRIDRFRGEYGFLSNFYGCKIIIQTKDGQLTFWNAEAAFQAMKTTDFEERMKFCDIKNPVKAKGLGRKLKLRKDWDVIRVSVMEYIVMEKFYQNGDLAQKLRGEDVDQNDDLHPGRERDAQFFLHDAGKQKQRQHQQADEHVIPRAQHDRAHQRREHHRLQDQPDNQCRAVGRPLLAERATEPISVLFRLFCFHRVSFLSSFDSTAF